MSPIRELATQIQDEAVMFGRYSRFCIWGTKWFMFIRKIFLVDSILISVDILAIFYTRTFNKMDKFLPENSYFLCLWLFSLKYSSFFTVYAAFISWILGYEDCLLTRSFNVQDIDLKTDYQSFKRKWGDDPRFLALERKDREHLLNERYDLRMSLGWNS